MVEIRRLRFRRHLLVCLLLALLNELRHNHESGSADHQTRSWLMTRRTRVKLASAYEISAVANGNSNNNNNNLAASAIYRHNTQLERGPIRKLLDSLHEFAPVINLNYSILSAPDRFSATGRLDEQIDAYYEGNFADGMTLDELQLMSVRAADRMAPTPLHISWGYASRELADLGSLPVREPDLCSLQLNHLAKRLDLALKQPAAGSFSAPDQSQADQLQAASSTGPIATPVDNFEARQVVKTGDLEMMRLLDTFGKVPSDFLRGNVRWYGSYGSCLATRLRPPAGGHQHGHQSIKFRYCLGAYKSNGWRNAEQLPASSSSSRPERGPGGGGGKLALASDYSIGPHNNNNNNNNRTNSMQRHFIRVGLCLPEACDSSALERVENARSLERLLKFNLAKPFNSDHYKLTELYCQPDSRSPLRTIPMAGKLLLAVALLWLVLVVAATAVHLNVDKFYLKTVELIRQQQQQTGDHHRRRRRRRSSSSDQQQRQQQQEQLERRAEPSGQNNEFHESDILNVKLNLIKLNVYIRDKSRRIIPGVDLIDCLSLYSNWLKWTKRLKLAIVKQHEHELELERRCSLNERLVVAKEIYTKNGATKKAASGLAAALNLKRDANDEVQQQADDGANDGMRVLDQQSGQFEAAYWRPRSRVDTSSLNALKVIALVWIMAGHCVFYLASIVSNGANLKELLPTLPAFALANGALYITELFFIITGCLTAYLAFERTTRLVELESSDGSVESHSRKGMEMRERSTCLSSSSSSQSDAKGTVCIELTGQDANRPPSGPAKGKVVALVEWRMFGLAGLPYFSLFALNRYLRILPTYLLVYATVKLVTVYVGGEGQLWDYAVGADSVRRACVQESWWPVLTLTSNFVEIYKHCIVGGWYLSVDMQFALMSIPLILLLAHGQRSSGRMSSVRDALDQFGKHQQQQQQQPDIDLQPAQRRPKGSRFVAVARAQRGLLLAYALIVALGLISGSLAIFQSMLNSPVDLAYILRLSPHTIAMMSQNLMMYTNSIFRIRAFAAGLLIGHLLYLYEFRLIKLPKFIQQHGSKLTVVIFTLGFCLMFTPVLLYRKIILSHDMTALLMVLSAGGIDLFLGSLIFLICIGKAPKAILFCLNSPMWSLLSALSLSAFLIHSEVIIILTSQLDPPPSVNFCLLLFVFSATLLLTYTLAFGLYLTFEMPISRLIDSTMRTLSSNKSDQRQQAIAAGGRSNSTATYKRTEPTDSS